MKWGPARAVSVCGSSCAAPSGPSPLRRAARCGAALVCSWTLSLILSFHNTTRSSNVFCHVTDFSSSTGYSPAPVANVTSSEGITDYISRGQPFLVPGVSDKWPASEKWSHAYFRRLFQGHALFSSTFSTPRQPQFEEDYPNKEIYYGIFLNDPALAELVANDYHYPRFIPENLRLYGM